MSLNWEAFKSALGSYWNTSCIVYVDEEGSEIPIGSDCEFQEALRVAKMNKNRLKLIFYDKAIPSSQKMIMTFPESVRIFTSGTEPNAEPLKNKKQNAKGNTCCCGGDVPPEWFTHYMKKFKKDLLHELRSNFLEIINNSIEKEKFLAEKSNLVDFVNEKNKAMLALVSAHTRKKKKVSDKDGVDLSEPRDKKLSKKLEKLHSSKSEKLEKLDNKTKLMMEEKKKLLEKKRHSKSKLDKNNLVASEKKNSPKKSAAFDVNDVFLFLVPRGGFTLRLNIENNGKLQWSSPQLEYYDPNNLFSNEVIVDLPKLLPNRSCFVNLRGRASNVLGLHHFRFRVIEEGKKICNGFTFWTIVDHLEPYEKYCNVPRNQEKTVVTAAHSGDSSEKSTDFDKDEFFASSKKKIEENIMEIEKRLQYIDLLRPSTNCEDSLKKTLGKTKKIFSENAEFQTENCELLQNSDGKEKEGTKRLEQEEVLFGVDCLRLDSESNESCEAKANPKTDESEQVETVEAFKKDCEVESSSDSELSVIFMSEEEENFIVVPLPSKSPSPAESVHEDKKSVNVDSEVRITASQDKTESVKEQPVKSAIKIKIHTQLDKETSTPENLSPNQFSPSWNRRSPFGEEIPISKPKKMKSKSTEYHFTTANLTQPTFTPIPDGFHSEKPSRFTFTGEKKEKPEGVFEFTFRAEKEEKNQKNDVRGRTVPKTDASGRVIYAVTNMGHCLPVGDLFENGEHSRNLREENSEADNQGNQNRPDKRSDRAHEIPSVNILPNALMNGASNVASIAFNTAKSVINNLQSAFVTEGKTELGKPAYEDKKKVSLENLIKLSEMGFCDLQKNRNLLLIHGNNISRVIEELVRLEENGSKHPE